MCETMVEEALTPSGLQMQRESPEPAPKPLSREQYGVGLAVLLGFALITCVAGLRGGPVMGDHECIVAQAARQCIQSGDWLIPYLGEIPRIRKTPVGIWLAGLSSFVFDDPAGPPVSAYSARMPSAIAGVLNALVVCWLGNLLYGRRAGLVAGFISAGCVATVVYARDAQVDMVLTLLTTLSFACFWRAFLHDGFSHFFAAVFYVAFAAAMMAKAPLPGVTVGMALAVFWVLTLFWKPGGRAGVKDDWRGLRDRRFYLWLGPGILIFLVFAGSWPLYAYFQVDNAASLWKMEYADRFSGDLSNRSRPPLYYVPILLGLTAPYMLSIPEALAAVFLERYRAYRRQLAYVFTWAVVGTVFVSLSPYKRPHYLLSMIPAYCLLLAPVIDRLFFGSLFAGGRIVRLTVRLVPVLLAAAAVGGGIVVQRELPCLLPAYFMIAAIAVIIWVTAALSFGFGRRTLSFALLQLAVPAIVVLGWPAAGVCMGHQPEVQALAEGFREHGVRPDDCIYWVGGRPDSRIEFYSGYRIQRLFNELEMAELREDRRTITPELLLTIAGRIRQRLTDPRGVYLIMAGGHYELMRRKTDIAAQVLFELPGFHEDPGDDLVIITQPRPGAAAVEPRSGSQPGR